MWGHGAVEALGDEDGVAGLGGGRGGGGLSGRCVSGGTGAVVWLWRMLRFGAGREGGAGARGSGIGRCGERIGSSPVLYMSRCDRRGRG